MFNIVPQSGDQLRALTRLWLIEVVIFGDGFGQIFEIITGGNGQGEEASLGPLPNILIGSITGSIRSRGDGRRIAAGSGHGARIALAVYNVKNRTVLAAAEPIGKPPSGNQPDHFAVEVAITICIQTDHRAGLCPALLDVKTFVIR